MTCSLFVATIHINVVTTYVYINYCFVSTYVYQYMIEFICRNSQWRTQLLVKTRAKIQR